MERTSGRESNYIYIHSHFNIYIKVRCVFKKVTSFSKTALVSNRKNAASKGIHFRK